MLMKCEMDIKNNNVSYESTEKRDRQTERDRETDRHADRHPYRQTDR